MPPPISVVICCANSQDTLERACLSAAWADEIVIVDSGSTDDTPKIAQKYASKYVVEPWRGYTGQKLYGTTLAKNDWVLVLDSDEECSQAFIDELQKMPDRKFADFDLFHIPRKNYIYGKFVRSWYPDLSNRLFDRSKVEWVDEVLHDKRKAKDPARESAMTGWLEHKKGSSAGWSDYFSGRRLDARLMPSARQMYNRGKRAGAFDLVFRPWAAFIKSYIFKLGFLDGTFGLLIAQKAAVSTQLKYAALWSIQQEEAGGGKSAK
jgi:(heptosyl)LPS beta-1,4-glucosyltransferase